MNQQKYRELLLHAVLPALRLQHPALDLLSFRTFEEKAFSGIEVLALQAIRRESRDLRVLKLGERSACGLCGAKGR